MKNIKLALIIIAGVFAVILLSVFAINSVENKAITLEEQINTAKADIKVQEKRRIDLIGNLVDCVKSYDKHEYNTLKDVVASRTSGNDTTDSDIQEVRTMINATAEAYPELKSDQNYKQLMNELSITENFIAEYRSNFNKQVKSYKRYVRKFPNRQFLGFLGYNTVNYEYLNFEVSEDAPKNLFGE